MTMIFEVGKEYYPCERGFDSIKILRRTEKTVWVDNGQSKWRMRVRKDENGNEYVIDSSVPQRWRDALTYKAEYPVEERR